MHTPHRPFPWLALLAAVALSPACKKAQDMATEAAIEHATGAKVDKDGNALTIKTEAGDMKITTGENGASVPLPTGFPSDIILPDKHKVASAMDVGGAQLINLTTPTALAAVYADTDKAMQAAGWKREMAMQATDSGSLAYSKAKRQVFYQLLAADDGGTQLSIRSGTSD